LVKKQTAARGIPAEKKMDAKIVAQGCQPFERCNVLRTGLAVVTKFEKRQPAIAADALLMYKIR
jgi:hypothetical protein